MYENMANLLRPQQRGDYRIDIYEIKANDISSIRYRITPGKYVRLLHNHNCVMSNTPMEERTNMNFCIKAHGDVLIGGLGIGMIILAIQNNENVKSITVLEKSLEVIEMITKQLGEKFTDKVRIIEADVFTYIPEKKYDTVYMDIWNYVNSDVYEEMKKLKCKYRKYMYPKKERPDRYIKCWAEYEAKNNQRIY